MVVESSNQNKIEEYTKLLEKTTTKLEENGIRVND